MIDESDLMMSVMEKDINTIISLLENKHELSEIVVHLDGVEKLRRCIKNYNKRKKDVYSEYICNSINDLEKSMNKLKELRESTSNYNEINQEEKKAEVQLQELIKEFKKLMEK